jgi:hypothetical protein
MGARAHISAAAIIPSGAKGLTLDKVFSQKRLG